MGGGYDGVPLGIGIGARGQKARMMGLPDGRTSFKIGLAVLIQYRHVTDGDPASQPRVFSNLTVIISVTYSTVGLPENWKRRPG